MNPKDCCSRAASQYIEGKNLVDMIKENLVAERVAIETYREMVRYFGDKDPRPARCWSAFWRRRKSMRMICMILLVQREGRGIFEEIGP